MAELVEKENTTEYIRKLKSDLELSTMWCVLQEKSEYGSDKSEKGYQRIVRSLAGGIARRLRLNDDMAELLAMCRGSFFAPYGKQGLEVILEVMHEKGIDIALTDFAREYVEYNIEGTRNYVTRDFDYILKSLFEEKVIDETPEVELVIVCYNSIEKVKRIENASIGRNVDLYRLCKGVEEECVRAGRPVESKELNLMMESATGTEDPEMSSSDRERIINSIQKFIDFYGTGKRAFFEYMIFSGPEL